MRAEPATTLPRLRVRRFAITIALMFLLLAVGITATFAALGREFPDALILGVIWGVAQTLIQAWHLLRQRRQRLRGCAPGLTRAQREAAVAASLSGPVPEDPVVRTEARRLVQAYVDEGVPGRSTAPLFVILLAGLAVAAELASAWWWLVAVVAAVMGVLIVFGVPRAHRRHLERLWVLTDGRTATD